MSMESFSQIIALFGQAAPGATPPNPIISLLPFILIMAAMWFLLIAPQRKKQKEHQKMVQALQSGDEVLTSGGIIGTITNVKSDRFVVKIADNTKIELHKSHVLSKFDSKS